jgi:hypothetical protein
MQHSESSILIWYYESCDISIAFLHSLMIHCICKSLLLFTHHIIKHLITWILDEAQVGRLDERVIRPVGDNISLGGPTLRCKSSG